MCAIDCEKRVVPAEPRSHQCGNDLLEWRPALCRLENEFDDALRGPADRQMDRHVVGHDPRLDLSVLASSKPHVPLPPMYSPTTRRYRIEPPWLLR